MAALSSLLIVAQPNPIYSVLLLIALSIGLAGLYVLLDAPLVAVMQIIVYAGAIMVLFLSVVMLLNVPREDSPLDSGSGRAERTAESSGARAFGALLAAILAVEFVWVLWGSGTSGGGQRESAWSIGEIGSILLRDHAIAFGATSVVLLIAMVGAVFLAGRRISRESGTGNSQPESRLTTDD